MQTTKTKVKSFFVRKNFRNTRPNFALLQLAKNQFAISCCFIQSTPTLRCLRIEFKNNSYNSYYSFKESGVSFIQKKVIQIFGVEWPREISLGNFFIQKSYPKKILPKDLIGLFNGTLFTVTKFTSFFYCDLKLLIRLKMVI